MNRRLRVILLPIALFALSLSAHAQNSPFANGWTLEGQSSSLQFQSIKKQSVIETSSFATLTGDIAANGDATVKVLLDSVDTQIDLRNVRMRFLFFETFTYPEATITTRVDPSLVADLGTVRRKTITLPYTLELHGVTQPGQTQVSVTLIDDDLVAVSTVSPINIAVADFNLLGGLEKLQEAAGVDIVPSTTVSFDFLFRANAAGVPATPEPTPTAPASVALEAEGDFSREACEGRFEILSRTGNIYFRPASSRLDAASEPLLNTVADIVSRCPDLTIQISGHTDSIGPSNENQRLSERRAASVAAYLTAKGIPETRMIAVGLGEDHPVADNATRANRSKNRRIEFAVAN